MMRTVGYQPTLIDRYRTAVTPIPGTLNNLKEMIDMQVDKTELVSPFAGWDQ